MAALAFGTSMVWLNPAEVDSALASILLLQMCAASSGYCSAGRRGWFDPVLVSGGDRRVIALVNLAASAWPGLTTWLLLAMFETTITRGHWPAVLAPNRVAALAIASTAPWAAGMSLPRTAAGLVWIALLVALASTRSFLPHIASLQSRPQGLADIAGDALACLVCPFLLLADAPAVRDVAVVTCVTLCSVACAAAGAVWVAERDWPLVCQS